jgi:alpha 1,6-mannosyltransferase
MTDTTGDEYVQEHFSHRPDIVDLYLGLAVPILKADLLRYLLLFAEGGIWADLDVSCGDVPIREWIPETLRAKAGLVVGWEFDVGWGENIVRQFESWTIMAAPGSAHLLMVINDIVDAIRGRMEVHGVPVEELTMEMAGNVIDLTGPRRLTRSVLKSLGLARNETVDVKSISHLLEPVLVEDVLILPGYSFASTANVYANKTGPALVTHHYAGSWKNENGAEV